jgi:MSHA biogenesis protein MshI
MSLIEKVTRLFTATPPKDLLGISLRQNSIAYCYVPKTATENHLPSCKETPLIASDYVHTLAELKQHEQLQGQCQLVLSASQYNIIQIDRPNVPENEILAALKWQIKDLVTYAPENMVIDYFYGPALPDGTERIYVICSPLDELQKIVMQLANEQLKLTAITTEEFAFAHLLPFSNDAQLLVCQQPHEELFILVVHQGHIVFHRHLRGFAQLGNKTKDELLMGIIDNLSLEIQKSSDYFERQLKQPVIKAIQLLLPVKYEQFIAEQLANNTNVTVKLLALPEAFENYRPLAAAIGATMPTTHIDSQEQEQV